MEERRKVLQNRTVNDEPMMGLIEFELNVTATYNGFFVSVFRKYVGMLRANSYFDRRKNALKVS